MANTTYDTIKSMKPAPWSKSTVADGNALNQNFLEPTHQKDLTLAAAIDQVKNTVDEYNEVINEINNIADAAQHQAQEAENSVVNLDANLNIVSAGLADAASAISALETNKQDKIYVDSTTISGDGSHDNPYTVIGGGGGGTPPSIEGNMGVSAVYIPEQNQYIIGLSGTKNLVFESSADTIVFGSSAAGKYNFEVNPELVNKWNMSLSSVNTGYGLSGNGTSTAPIGIDEYGMSTSYKYGWDPNTHKWAYINEGGGSSDNFDVTGDHHTISGDGSTANPYSVNTDEIATHDWVKEQGYIANIETDDTTISGSGTQNDKLGIVGSKVDYWNAHSALSATKLDKTIWDNNSGKFVTSAFEFEPNTQYAFTDHGWDEITGGGSSFTGAETNNWISGDGTSNKPIGLSAEAASAIEAMADQYQIDGGQYVSVVPNSTTHKVVVGLDNQATNAIADVIASANVWDEASAVSAKSHTTINNSTNIITTENNGITTSMSAVNYLSNHDTTGMNAQQLIVVTGDSEIYSHLDDINNKGTLFFVCKGV